jgi:hypothetical protein
MGYAPALPRHLAGDVAASLAARAEDGALRPHGGVQLFDATTAAQYGAYLKAMAANLKSSGLYDAVAAIHLEMGDAAELPETVDYSGHTLKRWHAFVAARYKNVAALNLAAGTKYGAFEDLPIPFRMLQPRAAKDLEGFLAKPQAKNAGMWGRFLTAKYKTPEELSGGER